MAHHTSNRLSYSTLCRVALAISIVSLSHGVLGKPASAQVSEIRTTPVENLAIGGFDPVSYFKAPAPAKGTEEFIYFWKGARWQFTSQANLEAFRADPESFAPAYGGHGAWPITVGQYLFGDPRLFTISDGRLFLHYSEATRDQWRADQAEMIVQADRRWAEGLENMR